MALSNDILDKDIEQHTQPSLLKQASIDLIDNYVHLLDPNGNGGSDDDFINTKHKSSSTLNKKRIIFIRHAKSTWNEASERSNVDRVSALTKGILESMYNKSIKDGGKYIDAPLSDLGILQCMDLNRFLSNHYTQYQLKTILKTVIKKKYVSSDARQEEKDNTNIAHRTSLAEELDSLPQTSKIRKGFAKLYDLTCKNSKNKVNVFVLDNIDIDNKQRSLKSNKTRDQLVAKDLISLSGADQNSSCVLTSNLRRAIDTAIIGLAIRWQTFPLENMHILSCLQEFGKGPDCFSKTEAKDIPKIAQYTQQNKRINLDSLQQFYSIRIDSSSNYGPKKDDNISRFDRMLEFCRYVFERSESSIIVVGHSIWFQRFCRIFLLEKNKNKRKKTHIAVSSKLYNAGCVGFDLCRIMKENTDYYGIDARTMVVVYKGFEKMNLKNSSKPQTQPTSSKINSPTQTVFQ